MARRGQCHCGAVLRFERGPEGYKMRCPHCGSIVRLRRESRRSKKQQPAAAMTGSAADTASPLAFVEMVAVPGMRPKPSAPLWRRWPMILLVLLGLAAAVGLVIGMMVT